MNSSAAITVLGSREEVEQRWRELGFCHEQIDKANATVRFVQAPGDHGTEIHVSLPPAGPIGKLREAVQKLTAAAPLAKAKDDLRHFKQLVETGVIARSEAVPEGERVERKLHQRPAQPLKDDELQKAGV